jgi:Tol biopolymer transport system component
MPLTIGEKLGPYEIVERLGAGGMGEVYRGNDPRLHRSVAIKISAEQFSERAEQEARAVAALNHPNVCTLYDIGPNYLVMELIEGETLADRIKKGPIPLEEALEIARQIADALGAAHERGIVHRDLKPANIKIRPDGSVKVLDFGLAKVGTTQPLSKDSPTMTTATVAGMILGTAAYMAPEQARGKSVDKRADIWAFGAVLWEMLTGHQLFEGETITDVLTNVLHKEPDWIRVPQRVRRLLRSCLERDPRKRLQDIGDARLMIDEDSPGVSAAASPPAVHTVSFALGNRAAWGVAALFVLLLAPLAWIHFREKLPVAEPVRFQVPLPEKFVFQYIALSPDGRYLAFSGATPNGINHIWLRSLDSLEARMLPGTENGGSPFWSPDSRYVAFVDGGKVRKIDITGAAPPITLCEISGNAGLGTWNKDNVIVFGARANGGGLRRVSAAGGTPVDITVVDPKRQETSHAFPQFLPDGKHLIYTRLSSEPGFAGLYTISLQAQTTDPPSKRLEASRNGAVYVPSTKPNTGQLLFDRDSTLMAQSFDAAALELGGEPVPIAAQIGFFGNSAWFSASASGALVYRTAGSVQRQLTWFDRKGDVLSHVGEPGVYSEVELSPDGTRAAFYQPSDQFDLWLFDLARSGRTRFTFAPGFDRYPIWSPDGSQIAYCSGNNNDTDVGLYRKASNGAGEPELLLKNGQVICPQDWSRDGKYLLYARVDRNKVDLWVLPMTGKPSEAKPMPYLISQFNQLEARFSPDGRWVAYESNESGKNEVYVRPFTPGGSSLAGEGKWMISNGNGMEPRWRRDGKQILYWNSTGKLMAVDVGAGGSSIKPGVPTPLFDLPIGGPGTGGLTSSWDLTPDGGEILANTEVGSAATAPITVVLNWQSMLRK